MAIIENFPVGYIHADRSGIITQVLNNAGILMVSDPSNGVLSPVDARFLFEPWMRDLDEPSATETPIFIVNDTGCTLTQDGTPIYDGGILESQPVLPDGKTVGVIPAGFTTDRGTYLGFGRFMLSAATFAQGGSMHGSGMALKMTATSEGFSQSFGIFVAAAWINDCGLDVCANVDGVDMQSRFDNGANKTKTPLGTLCTDHQGGIGLEAVILSRNDESGFTWGSAPTPFVVVRVRG